ncbi:hypothetical protein Nmel_014776, partial [Mimus melanotis]
ANGLASCARSNRAGERALPSVGLVLSLLLAVLLPPPRSWVAAGPAGGPRSPPSAARSREELRPMVKGPRRGLSRISVFGSGYGA